MMDPPHFEKLEEILVQGIAAKMNAGLMDVAAYVTETSHTDVEAYVGLKVNQETIKDTADYIRRSDDPWVRWTLTVPYAPREIYCDTR